MSWRVVYIEDSDYLSLYLDNIKIRRNSQDLLIPLSDIHTLIVDNTKAVLTVGLLNKCSEYKINVVLCGIAHLPQTLVIPVTGNKRAPLHLREQIEWSQGVKDLVHQKMIKAKIENQKQVLIKNNKDERTIQMLEKFIEEVLPGDPGNREGLAAKAYFRSLFGPGFIRFDEDPINAGLNYGYAIMRSQITKVILGRGLNPSLGIFHRGAENQFNLSDDFIEVFRPIVDNYVYKNLTAADALTRQHRLELVQLTTKKMKYNGENHTFFNVVSNYINNILDYINTGSVEKLIFPAFDNYDL